MAANNGSIQVLYKHVFPPNYALPQGLIRKDPNVSALHLKGVCPYERVHCKPCVDALSRLNHTRSLMLRASGGQGQLR